MLRSTHGSLAAVAALPIQLTAMTTRPLLAAALLLAIAAGCTTGRTVKQRSTASPAGRGVSVPNAPLGRSATQPAGLASPRSAATESLADALVGRAVSVHLTHGNPALSGTPRRDLVKGVLRDIDDQWIVLLSDAGQALYIPRGMVLAIEEK